MLYFISLFDKLAREIRKEFDLGFGRLANVLDAAELSLARLESIVYVLDYSVCILAQAAEFRGRCFTLLLLLLFRCLLLLLLIDCRKLKVVRRLISRTCITCRYLYGFSAIDISRRLIKWA